VDSLLLEKAKLEKHGQECPDVHIDLDNLTERLRIAKTSLENFTKVLIDRAAPHTDFSKVFICVDRDFIEKITGTSLIWREWRALDRISSSYIDVFPSPKFRENFHENSEFVCMYKEAGRRSVLEMFLKDILSRKEFGSALRLFPEYEFFVTSIVDSKPIKLSGKADYTIGHSAGKDIFDKEPSKELHLIAAEAKREWPDESYWQCVAQTAALHKSRKDAKKKNCRVWGILSNATLWRFLFIDEEGELWTSRDYQLGLRSYDENQALAIYRVIYHLVKSCHVASPPSTPEKM
jgi:hypothetical protein